MSEALLLALLFCIALATMWRSHARASRVRSEAEQQLCAYAGELEQANRDLCDAQTQLVQAEKMAALGALVAGVAHEINTPVGAIHSNADLARRALEMLKEGLGSDTPVHRARIDRAVLALEESVAITDSATRRIVGIVRTLRSFARLDEAEEKTVDLHEGIEGTLALLQHEMADRVEVIRDFGALPPLCCRPEQLNQVFMNLIGNAVQAMGAGGRITIRTRQLGEEAVLRFEDTGGGIAAEHLRRIFDPGFTTKGVGVGTGLGLAISYRIVGEHEGTITVESEPGQGTVFTVRLPYRQLGRSAPRSA